MGRWGDGETTGEGGEGGDGEMGRWGDGRLVVRAFYDLVSSEQDAVLRGHATRTHYLMLIFSILNAQFPILIHRRWEVAQFLIPLSPCPPISPSPHPPHPSTRQISPPIAVWLLAVRLIVARCLFRHNLISYLIEYG